MVVFVKSTVSPQFNLVLVDISEDYFKVMLESEYEESKQDESDVQVGREPIGGTEEGKRSDPIQ